jgi:hypothetical protein
MHFAQTIDRMIVFACCLGLLPPAPGHASMGDKHLWTLHFQAIDYPVEQLKFELRSYRSYSHVPWFWILKSESSCLKQYSNSCCKIPCIWGRTLYPLYAELPIWKTFFAKPCDQPSTCAKSMLVRLFPPLVAGGVTSGTRHLKLVCQGVTSPESQFVLGWAFATLACQDRLLSGPWSLPSSSSSSFHHAVFFIRSS